MASVEESLSRSNPSPSGETQPLLRVVLGGDVMLGRGVASAIAEHGTGYPLAPVAALMWEADLTLVNLECALTHSTEPWQGEKKDFYFRAPTKAVNCLSLAGIDVVSLANNHILDFGVSGLQDTIAALHSKNIAFAGAGEDLGLARRPAVLARKQARFGIVAYCDHQSSFAATPSNAGIAYLDLSNTTHALDVLKEDLADLYQMGVTWPILSLHYGPNRVTRPNTQFIALAHAIADMGWRIFFGHSAHFFHGVEIRHGNAIIYSAGDLVDDYYVDATLRNDLQVLFEAVLDADGIRELRFYPIYIHDCQADFASGKNFEAIAGTITARCKELGTTVHRDATRLVLPVRNSRLLEPT